MLNITMSLGQTKLFLVLLLLVGVILLYGSIIFDPAIDEEFLLDKGIIPANSMYDPEKLKEAMHTTGILLLTIGSIYMSFQLGKKSK